MRSLPAITALSLALATGCVTEHDLNQIDTGVYMPDENDDGLPDSGTLVDTEVYTGIDTGFDTATDEPNPYTGTPGFTLSELVNACIAEPLACPSGDLLCDEIGNEISATGNEFARQLSEHYDVPVDVEGLFAGDYDDELKATVAVRIFDEYFHQIPGVNSNPESFGGKMIIIPGEVVKDDMRDRIDRDTYYFDPLKCGQWELRDLTTGVPYQKDTYGGFTRDGGGPNFTYKYELIWEECWPGAGTSCIDSEIRRQPHARFFEGEANYDAAEIEMQTTAANIDAIMFQVYVDDQASSDPSDLSVYDIWERPVAWTTFESDL